MLDLGTNPQSPAKPVSAPAGASIEPHSATGGWFAAALIVVVVVSTGIIFFLDRATAAQATRRQRDIDQARLELTTGSLGQTANQARALASAGPGVWYRPHFAPILAPTILD